MKYFLLILLITFLSGCMMLGTSQIHSPVSDQGTPLKYWHIHGGATKKSPPNGLMFDFEDSTSITISAQTISEKKNFGGVILPIFPLFWLPKINYYKDQPDVLIIHVASESNNKIDLITDATRIVFKNESYPISNLTETDFKGNPYTLLENEPYKFWKLEFLLEAEKVEEFELTGLKFRMKSKEKPLPAIRFRKMKQRWTFLGP